MHQKDAYYHRHRGLVETVFGQCVGQLNQPMDLLKNRPWYRKKKHPTQLDVQWMFKEVLTSQAITPTPAFIDKVALFHPNCSYATAKAA